MAYHGVKVDVYKVQNYWWWSATDECANFRYSDYNEPVKTFSLNSDEKGRASFSLNFSNDEWGTYLIIASDAMSPVAHAPRLFRLARHYGGARRHQGHIPQRRY